MTDLYNILLIDDSKTSNELNQSLFTEIDVSTSVKSFTNGKEALLFLKEHMNEPTVLPNFIFLDLVMPTMSGFSFLEKYLDLQPQFKNEFKPILVILSEHSEESNFNKASLFKEYEFLEQLPKPLRKESINSLFKKYFSN